MLFIVTCLIFVFFYTGDNVTTPNCIIIPLNPSFLHADGGINSGTSNVMVNCKCFDVNYQQIRWYFPGQRKVTFSYAESEDLPYVINGTLIIPIFNNSYQGTYHCGVGNDSVFVANISLTLWTGMSVYLHACERVCVCTCMCTCVFVAELFRQSTE